MSSTKEERPEDEAKEDVSDDKEKEELQPVVEPRSPAPAEEATPENVTSSAENAAGSLFYWLKDRCVGRGLCVDPARDNYRAMTSLYSSIHPADSVNLSTRTHGAVFNLEYSPDG